MPAGFTESVVEEAALGWLETLGYKVKHGPEIAFDADGGERTDPGYRDTILQNRLYQALARLNPSLPETALGEVFRKLLRGDAPNLLARNHALHRMLVDGNCSTRLQVKWTPSAGRPRSNRDTGGEFGVHRLFTGR